jgi:flagellar motor switch protein FliN/FliY
MTLAKRTWLDERWAARLQEAIEGMTGFAVPVEAISSDSAREPAVAGGALGWRQGFDLDPDALAWFLAPEATWRELGAQTLRAAGVDPVDDPTARGTFLELLAQGVSGLASDFSAEAGQQVSVSPGAESSEFPAGLTWSSVRVTFPGSEPAILQAAWTQELIDALLAAGRSASSSGEEGGGAAARAPAGDSEPEGFGYAVSAAALRFGQSKTLDLLLDVELPIAVSFGRASVPLKDVLKLTSGSVVELNRTVAEPVEVIVNNCVIARGEVVVIEGNYGVRIQQIISPQERLRTLA